LWRFGGDPCAVGRCGARRGSDGSAEEFEKYGSGAGIYGFSARCEAARFLRNMDSRARKNQL
jgi:hypothetical protein